MSCSRGHSYFLAPLSERFCTAFTPSGLFLYLFLHSAIGCSFVPELLCVFLIVLYGLLHVVVSISGYLEWWIRKNVEGNGHGLIWDTIPVFMWSVWGKHHQASVRTGHVLLSVHAKQGTIAKILTHSSRTLYVDYVWNVMAHAQKPDFVFRLNERVHLNRWGCQFSRILAAEVCGSAVVILDKPRSEVVWRVLATHSIRQFPLHFPSRASPCAIIFQLDYTHLSLYLNSPSFPFPYLISICSSSFTPLHVLFSLVLLSLQKHSVCLPPSLQL